MTDLYKIKPLVWVEGKAGDGWRADTAYGWFNLFWSHERQEYRLLFAGAQGAIWHGPSDVDGRVFADQHYRQQLAQHLEPVPEAMQWRTDMENAPRDGSSFVVGGWVANIYGETWWEEHLIWLDDETGEIPAGCECPFAIEDFNYWMPLPAAPALAQVEKADG